MDHKRMLDFSIVSMCDEEAWFLEKGRLVYISAGKNACRCEEIIRLLAKTLPVSHLVLLKIAFNRICIVKGKGLLRKARKII